MSSGSAVKCTSPKTKLYHLAFGSLQGAGTFIIIRKADDATTLRYVCNEGLEHYRRLKRARRQSAAAFNAMCEQEEYRA